MQGSGTKEASILAYAIYATETNEKTDVAASDEVTVRLAALDDAACRVATVQATTVDKDAMPTSLKTEPGLSRNAKTEFA